MQQNSSLTTIPAFPQRGNQHYVLVGGSWPMEWPKYCAVLPGRQFQPFFHSNALPLRGGYPPPAIYQAPAPQNLQHPHYRYHHSVTYANPDPYSYHDQNGQFPSGKLGAFGPFTPSHPWHPSVQQPVPPYFQQPPPQYCHYQGFWGTPDALVQSSAPDVMITQPPLPRSFNRPMLGSGAYHSYQIPESPDKISRGPPRKPKQSGHALWVGNLPSNVSVWNLKDHFSKGARNEIESVFLISKTNCAFVNYITETACTSALETFNNLAFQGSRLVCRRRGSSNSASATSVNPSSIASSVFHHPSPSKSPVSDAPNVVDRDDEQTDEIPKEKEPICAIKTSERFFILKSLTVQDLEQCVIDGVWATQPHNEELLNSAYESAADVYLIFSVNKSGEYFGYACMSSSISDHAQTITSMADVSEGPVCIYTPATESAPEGRIIDDSARGTIFWESMRSDNEEEQVGEASEDGRNEGGSQKWGNKFTVEWKSTRRLPFYHTRGMRNLWNSNREIKVARDGTELEPGVGRRLVRLFHELDPSPIPYRGT